MEQFSFRQGNATIRHLKEPPKPKKKLNTDRVLFITLIIAVGLYGLFKLYSGIAIIEMDGMVTMDKLDVHFSDDIRLNSILVEEGASIEKGDTLFAYTNQYFENDAASYMNIISNKERIDREILDLRRKLNEKYSERTILENRVKEEREHLLALKELVSLAAISKSKFDEQERRVQMTSDKLQLIRQEIRFINNQISQLNKLKGEYQSMAGVNGGGYQRRIYVAPIDGVIGRINMEEREICYKEEDVMTLHQPEKVKVQAFFSQKVADKIEVGRIVNLEFPDGTKQLGKIDRFYVSTYELPPEFQKKYEPTTRSILVDIVPVDEESILDWQQFYKMNVRVTLGRFS